MARSALIAAALLAFACAAIGCTRVRIQIDQAISWADVDLREGEMSYGEALEATNRALRLSHQIAEKAQVASCHFALAEICRELSPGQS